MTRRWSKFRSGDPLCSIPADLLNALVDLVDRGAREFNRTGARDPMLSFPRSCVYPIYNGAGVDCDAFDVLGVNGPAVLPSDDENAFCYAPTLSGAVPYAADYAGKFAVLLEPIATGEVGRCIVAGVTPAWVDVLDTSHGYADLKTGTSASYTLASAGSGAAQILWYANHAAETEEGKLGEQWAIIRIGAGGSSPEVWSFILRTNLEVGGVAVAEKTIWRESEDACGPYDPTKQWKLCFCEPRTFFRVFDRLGEFSGTADLHCGIAHRLTDTPADPRLLCWEPGTPDEWNVDDASWQSDWIWDDRPFEIQRMVCANFLGCGCQDFWNNPCTAADETYPGG